MDMIKIFKFTLDDNKAVFLEDPDTGFYGPGWTFQGYEAVKFLSVGVQGNFPVVWVAVREVPTCRFTLGVRMTGQAISRYNLDGYFGTVELPNGIVSHIFKLFV